MDWVKKQEPALRKTGRNKQPPVRLAMVAAGCMISVLIGVHAWGWGGTAHSQITDAALTAVPADELATGLGAETRHLRETVEMGDWMNSLIVVHENWHVTTEDFPQVNAEYFGNDYLLFPQAPHFFHHDVPEVKGTYRPYFIRALQAMRTEDQANAVRWVGSLLHFVTDSGSPPHTIALHDENHGKMENWLDASTIDLHTYQPVLLGETDEQAASALEARMNALIARNSLIAAQMLPFAKANDRAAVEPLAMDCARETAKAAADVLHTLLVLASKPSAGNDASLIAVVSAPPSPEHHELPAKLILLGTNYSTLSDSVSAGNEVYSGVFSLRHLPPGTYRLAVERLGATTLFPASVTLAPGSRASFHWTLTPSAVPANLVRDADFRLHWVSATAPDNWRYDDGHKGWISDNIPVVAGHTYFASMQPLAGVGRRVQMEWMAQHWLATTDQKIEFSAATPSARVIAPEHAVYIRFVIAGSEPPDQAVREVAFVPESAGSFTPGQMKPAVTAP